jgi:hypothetical protein
MKNLRTHKTGYSPSFKRAATVLTLAAAGILYLGWRFKPGPDRHEPAQEAEYVEPAPEKAERRTGMPPALAPVPGKTESEPRAEKVLERLKKEFPRGSLDCQSEFQKTAESSPPPHQEAPKAGDQPGEKPASGIMSVLESAEPQVKKLSEGIVTSTKYITSIYDRTDLDEAIEQLGERGNPEAIIPLLRHMMSLDPKRNVSDETLRDFANLYPDYFYMGNATDPGSVADLGSVVTPVTIDDTASGDWDNVPGLACMTRSAYARKTAYEIVDALAGSLLRNPRSAESTLRQLSQPERMVVLNGCVKGTFFSDGFDGPRVERFLSALSPATRTQFTGALEDAFASEDQVRVAEQLAAHASDPEVRKAMGGVAAKWKNDVEALDNDAAKDLKDPEDSENLGTEPGNGSEDQPEDPGTENWNQGTEDTE